VLHLTVGTTSHTDCKINACSDSGAFESVHVLGGRSVFYLQKGAGDDWRRGPLQGAEQVLGRHRQAVRLDLRPGEVRQG